MIYTPPPLNKHKRCYWGSSNKLQLTPKQEAFALGVVCGLNLSDAYRRAGYKGGTRKTVNEAASRLYKNSKVIARIEELHRPIVERTQITLERHLEILEEIRDKAVEKSKYGMAINAYIALGRALGFY